MAFIKLNEVTLVESAVEPNILIEEDGEIKRLPAENFVTPQTQADWNETDATKASFILNKPESLGGGSGGKVVTYTDNSGTWMLDGNVVTAQDVLNEWNAGSILRYRTNNYQSGMFTDYSILYVSHQYGSGGTYVDVGYDIYSGGMQHKYFWY
jgi:hypothetical protein